MWRQPIFPQTAEWSFSRRRTSMAKTTKVVAWVSAIFGTVLVAAVALIIGLTMYADYRNAEQQRQREKPLTTLKQGITQDLQNLSKMEIKPMSGDRTMKMSVFVQPDRMTTPQPARATAAPA